MVKQRQKLKAIRLKKLPTVSKFIVGASFLFLIAFGIFLISSFRESPKEPFIGVAVFGDPASVVYLDRETKRTFFISLPASTVVDTCASYGTYPVSSLWRLGEIEKRGGTIFAASLSTSLGIPIRYYIGPQTTPTTSTNIQESLPQMFHLLSIPKILAGFIKTNMPLGTYLEVTRAVGKSIMSSKILDLSRTYAISEVQDTGGMIEHKINPDGADLVFRQTHEIGSLRQENLRVAIINTTGVAGLGLKVARILSHAGVTIVGTSSEEKKFDTCEVSVGKNGLSSVTVKTIVSYLSCNVRESEDTGSADIVLRLSKKEIAMY